VTSSRARVEAALAQHDTPVEIVEFPASTRTAVEAAAVIGCEVSQIVKSLVFVTRQTDRAVLVLASGGNQVDEKKLRTLLDEKVSKASAEFVRERTGFAIGGVAPVGHQQIDVVFADEDLLVLGDLWAAAGSPNAVFRLSATELESITQATIADVKRA